MKVRIIENQRKDNSNFNSINELIGKEFIVFKHLGRGNISICPNVYEDIQVVVFDGEYEIIGDDNCEDKN